MSLTAPSPRLPELTDVIYAADAFSDAELDALPYGMIQLDAEGRILRYSRPETEFSGLTAAECVGRSFFDEIAPCAHVREFYGRFLDGVRSGRLDVLFTFEFGFTPPRQVRIHMFYSKVTRSVWIKVVDLSRPLPPAEPA